MGRCYCYILYSQDIDKYYVGYTCDEIEKRVARHRATNKGFTNRAKDWDVVHLEEYLTKEEAKARRVK
ncbi:MAG: GIY-YIG nuclease family protein [Chitinophagales bacterium]